MSASMSIEIEGAYLYGLSMLPEYIDSYDGFVEVRICALGNIIIQVFLVPEHIHPFKYEIK